ncbi:hypothetical protein D3C72_1477920 [compost metagenome]
MYSDDYEYANSRLTETIVRLKGQPVYIYKVHPGMKVDYSELEDLHTMKRCQLEDLDLKPVPLGYCNYNKNACYLTRMPMRRDWRQGLRRGNFTSLSGVDANRIPYDVLKQCIIGDYPTFTACLEAVKKLKSIAWHRHWAVDSAGQVLHKGGNRPVGIVDNGAVVLSSRYQYLKEALKESL